jgi:signal transduction histidine kinase
LPKAPERGLQVRHNLFLIIKEALNNVVKHSAATEVRFRLRFDNARLQIAISDNGQGFSLGTEQSFGNGLLNMRKRAEHIRGELTMQSEPGNGTGVVVSLPLREMMKRHASN